MAQACALLDVGRGAYYRAQAPQAAGAPETGRGAEATAPEAGALVAAIEEILTEFPGYGYPRVTKQLQRVGWEVNHKRIYRVMGDAALLQRGKRERRVRTTQSDPELPVYPHLLADRGWRRLTRPDEAWGADLTYVRLGQEFCYLAVLLDLYTRRVVGWQVAADLGTEGPLGALEQALSERQPAPGWIHHSDRGSQYGSAAYVLRLAAAGARISMTGVGAPKENAPVERLMRTVKEEEVNLQEYRNLREAQAGLGHFLGAVYNVKRLHTALGYRAPAEFEALITAGVLG